MKAQYLFLASILLLCTFDRAHSYCLWKGNEELRVLIDSAISVFYNSGAAQETYNQYWVGEQLSVLDSAEKFVLPEVPTPLPGGALERVLDKEALVVEVWDGQTPNWFEFNETSEEYSGYFVDVMTFVAEYIESAYGSPVELQWRVPFEGYSQSFHDIDLGFADVFAGYNYFSSEERFQEKLQQTGSYFADSSALVFGPLADRLENPVYSWAALAKRNIKIGVLWTDAYAGVLINFIPMDNVLFLESATDAVEALLNEEVHAVLGDKELIDAIAMVVPELRTLQNYGPIVTSRLAVRQDATDCETECPVENEVEPEFDDVEIWPLENGYILSYELTIGGASRVAQVGLEYSFDNMEWTELVYNSYADWDLGLGVTPSDYNLVYVSNPLYGDYYLRLVASDGVRTGYSDSFPVSIKQTVQGTPNVVFCGDEKPYFIYYKANGPAYGGRDGMGHSNSRAEMERPRDYKYYVRALPEECRPPVLNDC